MTLNFASMIRSMPKPTTLAGLLAIFAVLFAPFPASAGPLPGYPAATQPYQPADAVIGTQSGVTKQFTVAGLTNSAVTAGGFVYTAIGTQHLGANKTFTVAGYRTNGDLGANCVFTSTNATSTGPDATQDADGVWVNLVIAGPVRVGCFGAYGDYNFATFAASISGTSMVVVGAPYGILLPGQTVTAPGVPANTVIVSGPSSGSFGTYVLSNGASIPIVTTACGCSYNSTTGLVTLTTAAPHGLSVGQAFRLTGITGAGVDLQQLNNRWVAEAGTTGSTILFHMGNWKIGATGALTAPDISSITAAVLNIQMSSYGGHDDTAALKAAVAIGADVDASGGLPATTPRNNYANLFFGVTDSIILPFSMQQMTMNNAALVPIPGWTGTPVQFQANGVTVTPTLCSQMPGGACYVLVANGPSQIVDKAGCDGGQTLGVVAGCFFLGSGRNRFINSFATHSAVAQVCACGSSGDSFIIGGYFQEWSNQEAEYNYDPDYLGDGILITRPDDQIYQTITRWTKINLHFAAGSQTTLIADMHPYQGRQFPQSPRTNAINLQTDVGFGGGLIAKNFYDDEGINEFYSSANVQPNLFWVLQQGKTSTISTPDQTTVHVYANGTNFPYQLDYSFLPNSSYPSDWHLIQYVDNPNLAAIGSVVTGGGHVQYVLAGGMHWTGSNGGVSELVNTPQPQVNTRVTSANFGTGGYNLPRSTVFASDATSVTLTNSTTTATTYGTIQLNWNTDWTNFNALVNWQGMTVDNKLPIVHVFNGNTLDIPGTYTNPDEVYVRDFGSEFDRSYTFLPVGAGALPLTTPPIGHSLWFTGTQGGVLPAGTNQTGLQIGPEGANDSCLILGIDSTVANDAYVCNPHTGTMVFGRNGIDQMVMAGGLFRPVTDGGVALGTAGLHFSNLFLNGFSRVGVTTVAGLATVDASPQVGDQISVSDAVACTANATPTGGGALTCALEYSGAAWKAVVTH